MSSEHDKDGIQASSKNNEPDELEEIHTLDDLKKIYFGRQKTLREIVNPRNDSDTGEYRIAICQDGKFAVTFDTGRIY